MFMCRLDRGKRNTIFLTAWTVNPLTSTLLMLMSFLASSAFSKQTIAYVNRPKTIKIIGKTFVRKKGRQDKPPPPKKGTLLYKNDHLLIRLW